MSTSLDKDLGAVRRALGAELGARGYSVAEKDSPTVDVLRQAGLSVLLYEVADGSVAFVDLEAALALIARRSGRPD